MTQDQPLLSCSGIEKSYDGRMILNNVNLCLRRGAIALTGANGAGKSTLIATLAGIEPVDRGTIQICGADLVSAPIVARRQLAFVPDESIAYDFMTGSEFLLMVCALRGGRLTAADDALHQRLGLAPHLAQRVEAMSLGTRKKLMLASALLGSAAVILMDEPTNGIDAAAKAVLADAIRQRKHESLIFFSTHDDEFIQAADAQQMPIHLLNAAEEARIPA